MIRIVPFTRENSAATENAAEQRILDLWPGLDAAELSRCGGDPEQIAGLISQHAHVTIDEVTGTLVKLDRAEPPYYFG